MAHLREGRRWGWAMVGSLCAQPQMLQEYAEAHRSLQGSVALSQAGFLSDNGIGQSRGSQRDFQKGQESRFSQVIHEHLSLPGRKCASFPSRSSVESLAVGGCGEICFVMGEHGVRSIHWGSYSLHGHRGSCHTDLLHLTHLNPGNTAVLCVL